MPDPVAVVEPLPRRRGRPPVPIEHGTEKGYRQHKSKREPIPAGDPCGCQAAHDATLKRATAQQPEQPAAAVADDVLVSIHVEESLTLDPEPLEQPSVAIGRDLADWLTEASASPATAVRRSAAAALRLLEELLDALDELSRAERAAARPSAGSSA